ncbi:DUF305 domain-containing protein [Pseudorhodobacter sp.]|uniref:CopM family metallochaperone n=1 Tax=Pseudorhodobacter sp. TaxID=1934400 RepID=UPI002AFFA96B|nr:DUF305 domain-containing protein [Pseudorhodobacter sp.]
MAPEGTVFFSPSRLPLMAQTDHSQHQMAGDKAPASRALVEANMKMHAEKNSPLTGDADVGFIAGMIPHHQGAVEMAQIVLQYGTDPEVRKMAASAIATQEAEIAWMKGWLARNGH